MLRILEDKTICLTRGDVANIEVSAKLQDKTAYTFKNGDVVRFRVYKRRECGCTMIKKDVSVEAPTETVTVRLTKSDTTIGEPGCRPVDYCYEVEVNPDTEPQTIIGHDEDGEKIFRLYPEGSDAD